MTPEQLKQRDERRRKQDEPKIREIYERRRIKRYNEALKRWAARGWL